MRRFLLIGIILLLLAVGHVLAQDSDFAGTPEAICEAAVPAEEPASREFGEAEQVLEEDVDYRAIFCTEAGPIYVDLFEAHTPVTVNNFVFLARNNYYNNITFHRVIADFMAQGGDPTGTGTGGPGYSFKDEFVGYLRFDQPGLLAMANAGPGTNGSQFFLTTAAASHLDLRHTIFGEVLTGMENLEGISLRDPQTATEPGDALDTIVIITDPEAVEADYETPERVTAEDLEAVLAELPDLPGVALREATGVYDTDALVSTFAGDTQEQVQEILDSYNHQFSTIIGHENSACDLETAPFESIGYQIHVFETEADAEAALEDESLGQLFEIPEDAESSESELLPNPVYSWETSACEQDGLSVLTYMKNGRLIMAAESTYPADQPFDADLWLSQVVRNQLYELIFYNVLRAAASGA